MRKTFSPILWVYRAKVDGKLLARLETSWIWLSNVLGAYTEAQGLHVLPCGAYVQHCVTDEFCPRMGREAPKYCIPLSLAPPYEIRSKDPIQVYGWDIIAPHNLEVVLSFQSSHNTCNVVPQGWCGKGHLRFRGFTRGAHLDVTVLVTFFHIYRGMLHFCITFSPSLSTLRPSTAGSGVLTSR